MALRRFVEGCFILAARRSIANVENHDSTANDFDDFNKNRNFAFEQIKKRNKNEFETVRLIDFCFEVGYNPKNSGRVCPSTF